MTATACIVGLLAAKPHLVRDDFGWLCAGKGLIGIGLTIREAYDAWLIRVENDGFMYADGYVGSVR